VVGITTKEQLDIVRSVLGHIHPENQFGDDVEGQFTVAVTGRW
jgi:hypothetical protein